MKYDISIILCSINPERWTGIYNQIKQSVNRHSFEVIAVGPNFPNKELEKVSNFKFLRDFGSPSRCLQMAATIAEGIYISWISDDCLIESGAFSDCIDFLNTKTMKDGMTVLYSEGPNFTGYQYLQPEYWVARTHADQRLKGVKEGWKCAPHFIYNLKYFREIGGLDCRWEHANMNTHDLAFRIQNDGGTIYLSPRKVMALNWVPWDNNNKGPMQLAYEENDAPLFKQIYDSDLERTIKIDYNNWQNSESVWKRRPIIEN